MQKTILRTLAACVAVGVLACAQPVAPVEAAPQNKVYLQETLLATEKPILNVNNRTMVAFRDLFTALGTSVSWDAEQRVATCLHNNERITIYPDRGEVLINGAQAALDVPPQIIDDHIYLPLRFFGEHLGYTVNHAQDAEGNNVVTLSQSSDVDVIDDGFVTVALPPAENQKDQVFYRDDDDVIRLAETDGVLYQERISVPSGDLKRQHTALTEGVRLVEPYRNAEGRMVIADNDNLRRVLTSATSALPKGDYLGFGEPVEYLPPLETIFHKRLPVYLSKGTRLTTDGQVGSLVTVREETPGYVLEISDFNLGENKANYARSADGVVGYLLGNDLLLLEMDRDSNPEGRVRFEAESRGDHLVAVDNVFYTYGFENNAIYVSDVSSDTFYQKPYRPVYTFETDETLRLYDFDVDGHTLYALVRDPFRAFVVEVDLKTGRAEMVALPKGISFSRLIPGTDGVYSAAAVKETEMLIYSLS